MGYLTNCSQTRAMLGVAKLGEQHGRGDLGKGVSKTEEDTAAHEHYGM